VKTLPGYYTRPVTMSHMASYPSLEALQISAPTIAKAIPSMLHQLGQVSVQKPLRA
jgi:hypothetical protein